MLIKKFSLFVLITLVLSGCSYSTKVSGISTPIDGIQKNSQSNCSIGYYFEKDLNSLNKTIKPSTYVCKMASFPIEAKEAFKNSLMRVLESSYANVEEASDPKFSGTENEFNFIFELVSFDPSIELSMYETFIQILFQVYTHIKAESKISLKVKVFNKNGDQILSTTISGEGAEKGKGQCYEGSDYLAKATEHAIEELLRRFVNKVVNSENLTAKI